MNYRDKVAIVTGGASGIGRALCLALARQGARVTLVDIDTEGAHAAAAAINAIHAGRAEARTLDVTRTAEFERLIEEVAAAHGRLDYLFNNAGIAVGGEARDLAHADWRRIVELNLMSTVFGSLAAYRIMVRQGGGHIVNTASAAGLLPSPVMSAYCATKFGVVGFSETLRVEGADLGVKVTVLCPGFVESNIFKAATLVGASSGDLRAMVPFPFIGADDAAARMLKGVAANRARVAFPGYIHAMLWLYRLLPGLMALANRKAIRDFRRVRKVGYREERGASTQHER